MKFLIKHLVAAAAVGLLGWAVPASAQTSTSGVNPTLISGDQSATRIAEVCGISPENIRGQVVLSPPTALPPGGGFDVDVTVTGDKLAFTDASTPPDQFNGTVGIEAVGVRRNGTYVYCYGDAVADGNLDAPGSGAPNQVTFVWGPGPCPLEDADVAAICDIYNTPEHTVDYIQGQLVETDVSVNLCACPPNDVAFCDPTLPQGTAGACVPAGESNEFQGSEFTGSSTVGTGTCAVGQTTVLVPFKSGGTVRYYTVCK